MAKDTRIAFRTSQETKDRLANAAKAVRLSETDLAEACVEALLDYIDEHGEITMPLAMLPKSALKRLKAAVGDPFVSASVPNPAPAYRANEASSPEEKPLESGRKPGSLGKSAQSVDLTEQSLRGGKENLKK